MSEWKTTRIRDVAEVYDGPHATPKKVEKGPWYLSISSLRRGQLDLSKSVHISEVDFPKWTRRVAPQVGDTLFSYETRLGQAAYWALEAEAALGRRMGLLRPKRGLIEPRYLCYAYLGPQFQEVIRQHTLSGATVDRIPVGEMPNWPILLPSLETQRAVLSVLNSIDGLIENNRRRIEVLEEMARAIYREWFVRFRFPGHQNVPIVDSPLGPVPEGWQVRQLGDMSSVLTRGIAPKYSADGEWRVINQRCIREGRVTLDLARRHGRGVAGAKQVRPGDVLINSTGVGTLGRVGVYRGPQEGVTVDSHVTICRAADEAYACWYGMSLMSEQSTLERLGTGATGQTELRRSDVEQLSLVQPSCPIAQMFAELIHPMYEMVDTLMGQISALSAARDLLLPKLVTGQVDVSGLDLEVADAKEEAR